MNKDLHNIDDLFKNSIDGHLEEVPPDVWNNIDHGLDKKQAAFYKRKYFAFRAAAILLILVGGVTIAAILHFNQRGRNSVNPDGQNTVTTSNSKGDNSAKETSTQKGSSQNLVVEKKNNERSTVLNSNGDKQDNEASNAVGHKQGSSKKYGAVNDDNYTAQENKEVTVGTNKNRSATQNEPVKYKHITKSSVELVVNKQQDNSQEKIVDQYNSPVTQTETIKDVQRTTYLDASLLSVNKVDPATSSLATNGLNRLPISLPTVSSISKPIRLRNHYNSWSLSPMYAQNINLNTLKDDDNFRDPRNNSREARRTEQETASFTIGLGVQRQISRNIVLESGIQYFSSETNIQPKTIFAEQGPGGDVRFRFSCSSGESYLPTKNGAPPMSGDSIKTNFSKSEISYFQVPLLVSYQINFGKVSLMPSAGIQTNFLIHGKLNSFLEHQTGEEEVSSSIDGLRSAYISGVIQPQINYKLSDRISFDFNPNINFSLSPINKETAVKTYQNMFSVGAGVRIKL